MKLLTLAFVGLLSLTSFADEPREIVFKTEKINDVVHWTPKTADVVPGEKIKIVAKHELEGGFNFHGFAIKALNIDKQVNRNEAFEEVVTVPKDLSPGEYVIGCKYHPAHQGAKLVVKDPAAKAAETPAAAAPDAPASTKPQKLNKSKGK